MKSDLLRVPIPACGGGPSAGASQVYIKITSYCSWV